MSLHFQRNKKESRKIIAEETGPILIPGDTQPLFSPKVCSLHGERTANLWACPPCNAFEQHTFFGRIAFSLNSLFLMELRELLVETQCAQSCQSPIAFTMLGFLLENRGLLKSKSGQTVRVIRILGKQPVSLIQIPLAVS